ncbi:MAG: alginate export family protein [candidate division Zixibacteria bacterium]
MTLKQPIVTIGLLFGICLYLFSSQIAVAEGEPEYMRLDFEKIPAVEIKGDWDNDQGAFITSDIEELPQPRRPKLRGILQIVDSKKETITMYGISIEIDDKTQFTDSGDGLTTINDLKEGQWLEVTCKVREDGNWEARKINHKNIKKSNKIKGTLTGVSVDGNPPDTLEIHGLKILLNRKTDVNYPGSSFQKIEEDLFDELAWARAYYSDYGFIAGDKFLISGNFRQSAKNESEYDLSDLYLNDQRDAQPEIRAELAGYFNDIFRAFGQISIRERIYLDSERINPPSKKLESRVTQLYVLAKNIGVQGFAVQVGRQDIEDPREWLFDEYLDAVRLYYYGKAPVIYELAYIHSDFQLKNKYRTWSDIFARARWQVNNKNTVSGYLLVRKDSDQARNREPSWYGAGYMGKVGDYFNPWAELVIMKGTDKGKSLSASAMDLGVTAIAENVNYSPSITVAYARGSGEKTGADDNEFRQTGFQDNTGYFGGVRIFKYYGELLDPELSNLIITTFGVGFKPIYNGSIEVVYHVYKQDQPEADLRGDLIDPPARPNGVSDDIGTSLDIVLGVSKLWNRVHIGWVFGMFTPGEAYSPFDKKATINRFNLKIDI